MRNPAKTRAPSACRALLVVHAEGDHRTVRKRARALLHACPLPSAGSGAAK